MIACEVCLSPVFKSGTSYFHDVMPRSIGTIARDVMELDEQRAQSPGIVQDRAEENLEGKRAA